MWRVKVVLFALIYVLSPIDLMSEILLGPLGACDDIVVIINAVNKLRQGNQG